MVLQRLKLLLNSRSASIVCLALACFGRTIHLLSSFVLQTDRSLQLQAAKNLYHGNGISIYQVSSNDLSQFEYAPLVNWPPLYSLLISPFNSLGENGFLIGAVLIDLLTCLTFVWLARKIYSLLETEKWKINLFTLVTGFSFYHFAQGRSTDLLALVFLLAGCFITLRSIKKNSFTPGNLVLVILFLWLSGFTRYLSIPLSFCIPALLFLNGYSQGNAAYKRTSLLLAIGLMFFFGLQYFIQSSLGGAGSYLYPADKGFYPKQLLQTGPFLFAASGNLEPLALAGEKYLGLSFQNIQQTFIYLNLLLVMALLIYCLNTFFRSKMKEGRPFPFQVLAFLFSVFTLGVLGYLSLTEKAQLKWTYVSELRYYAAAIFFIQLCLFQFVFRKGSPRFLRVAVGVIMLFSTLHGFLFTTKALIKNRTQLDPRNSLAEFDRNLDHIPDPVKTSSLIVLSNEPAFSSLVSIRNRIPGTYRLLDSFPTTKPLTAIVAFRKNFGAGYLRNLPLGESEKIAENGSWIFYQKNILPSK